MKLKNVVGSQAFFMIGGQGQNLEANNVGTFPETDQAIADARKYVAGGSLAFCNDGRDIIPDPFVKAAIPVLTPAPASEPEPASDLEGDEASSIAIVDSVVIPPIAQPPVVPPADQPPVTPVPVVTPSAGAATIVAGANVPKPAPRPGV